MAGYEGRRSRAPGKTLARRALTALRNGTILDPRDCLPDPRMKRASRLLLLLVPLAFGWLSHVQPGRAEEGTSSRFAFADTTLLRDTLDLHFVRLFPLADSLRMTPDTLRALSIRYQLSIERLVAIADSMRVPVDSVGAMMERQQFSPLAVTSRTTNAFRYSSSYIIAQTSTTGG